MGAHPSILIAEDDDAIRDTLQDLLEFEGYTVAAARDGREALAMLQGWPGISLVLLDMRMPHMNGFEFLAEARRRTDLPRVPVLVMSAHVSASEVLGHDGVVGFLVKPFELEDLLTRVNAVCRTAERL